MFDWKKTSQVYQFTNELKLLICLLIIQKNLMVLVYMQDPSNKRTFRTFVYMFLQTNVLYKRTLTYIRKAETTFQWEKWDIFFYHKKAPKIKFTAKYLRILDYFCWSSFSNKSHKEVGTYLSKNVSAPIHQLTLGFSIWYPNQVLVEL